MALPGNGGQRSLAQWFPEHAQGMDCALAETMKFCGFDPETGTMTGPPAPEPPAITNGGGVSCS